MCCASLLETVNLRLTRGRKTIMRKIIIVRVAMEQYALLDTPIGANPVQKSAETTLKTRLVLRLTLPNRQYTPPGPP